MELTRAIENSLAVASLLFLVCQVFVPLVKHTSKSSVEPFDEMRLRLCYYVLDWSLFEKRFHVFVSQSSLGVGHQNLGLLSNLLKRFKYGWHDVVVVSFFHRNNRREFAKNVYARQTVFIFLFLKLLVCNKKHIHLILMISTRSNKAVFRRLSAYFLELLFSNSFL